MKRYRITQAPSRHPPHAPYYTLERKVLFGWEYIAGGFTYRLLRAEANQCDAKPKLVEEFEI